MKSLPLLLTAAALFALTARTYGADEALKTETEIRDAASAPIATELKANEIKIGNITYSGILVQAIKSDNLLQLFNPYAPAKYGAAQDNLVLHPYNKTPLGLKIFALEF